MGSAAENILKLCTYLVDSPADHVKIVARWVDCLHKLLEKSSAWTNLGPLPIRAQAGGALCFEGPGPGGAKA